MNFRRFVISVFLRYPVEYTLATCPIFRDHLSIPENVHDFDQYAHDMGVLFILIAIFMESADLVFLALNNWGLDFAGFKYFEIAVLFVLNVLAAVTFALFGMRLLRSDV